VQPAAHWPLWFTHRLGQLQRFEREAAVAASGELDAAQIAPVGAEGLGAGAEALARPLHDALVVVVAEAKQLLLLAEAQVGDACRCRRHEHAADGGVRGDSGSGTGAGQRGRGAEIYGFVVNIFKSVIPAQGSRLDGHLGTEVEKHILLQCESRSGRMSSVRQ
jgi:hypothetical protein